MIGETGRVSLAETGVNGPRRENPRVEQGTNEIPIPSELGVPAQSSTNPITTTDEALTLMQLRQALAFKGQSTHLDKANFQVHGVPDAGNISVANDEQAPSYVTAKEIIQTHLTSHPALQMFYSSEASVQNSHKDGPIAILVSDIHQTPTRQAESVNFLMDLYRDRELLLGDGLLESLTKERANKNLPPKRTGDILRTRLAEAMLERPIEFYAGEGASCRMRQHLALVSLAYHLHGESSTEFKKALHDLMSDGKFHRDSTMKFLNQIAEDLRREFNLDSRSRTSITIKIGEPFKQTITIPLIKIPNIDSLAKFKSVYRAYCGLRRDDIFAEQLAKFKTGIHPFPVGAMHLPTVTKRLEQRGIPVIVISHKDFGDLKDYVSKRLQRLADNTVDAYEHSVMQRYQQCKIEINSIH